jgi:hypothetical protein
MKYILFALLGLVVGVGIGMQVKHGDYLNGRLSACKDMTSEMNKASPVTLQCTVDGGEVYITILEVPGVKFTLDGKRL